MCGTVGYVGPREGRHTPHLVAEMLEPIAVEAEQLAAGVTGEALGL